MVKTYRYFTYIEATNRRTHLTDSLTIIINADECGCDMDFLTLADELEKRMAQELGGKISDWRGYTIKALNCLNPCNHNHN